MTDAPKTTTTTTPTTTTTARAAPRHLLVCVDVQDDSGCEFAHALVEQATAWARALDARMTVFSVLPPLTTPAVPPFGGETPAYRALVARATEQSDSWRRIVETLAERARLHGARAELHLSEGDGHAADRICAAAVDVDADLVMLASHSRRGLAHAVLGSVAERTVARSTVPVLVVPRAALLDR